MNVPHQHISLSALNGKIKAAISNIFSGMNFWVVADVTNHHHKLSSNYHYFELVEKNPLSNDILAKISGSAFGSGSIRIAEFEYVTGQRFSENIHVLVNVSVDYHPIYGLRVSLNDIDPAFTLGALAMERAATLARLVRENPAFINQVGDKYVTRNGYMKLNPVIQKIALLSSRGSAGAEDLKHSLEHNPHGYVFYVEDYFTAVQGDANAEDFKDRMVDIFNAGIAYDVVVIARGGGAQTDFLLFDNYLVGKAIAKFPIPVITGIGHQKNETIADLMANTALKTPTKVAEFIIAHNKGFEDRLLSLQQQIVINAQQLFFNHSNLLVNLQSKMGIRPSLLLNNRRNDIQNIIQQLKRSKVNYIKLQQSGLQHFQKIFAVLSPESILKKGFAIVKLNQRITSDPAKIQIGDDIDIILSATTITSTVKEKKPYDGTDFKL